MKAYTRGYMKTFIPIIIGLVVIIAGWKLLGTKKVAVSTASTTPSVVDMAEMSLFSGEAKKLVNGVEEVLPFSIAIPVDATTSVGMNGSLFSIKTPTRTYASMYFSYEGDRKYTPELYVKNVMTPRVKVITPLGEAMIGTTMWYKVASDKSEWHIASLMDGKWLVVIESGKDIGEMVKTTLSSFGVTEGVMVPEVK